MFCPGCARGLAPEVPRAQGRPGAGWHPWAPCGRLAHKCTGRSQGQPGHPGLPCASGLTAYAALSPATNSLLSPSPRGLTARSEPVGPISPPQGLAVATTARTTRFCRTRERRSSCTPSGAHGVRLNPSPALPFMGRADAARVHRNPSTSRDDSRSAPRTGWDAPHIRQIRISVKPNFVAGLTSRAAAKEPGAEQRK